MCPVRVLGMEILNDLASVGVRYTGISVAIVAESFIRKKYSIDWWRSWFVLVSSKARLVYSINYLRFQDIREKGWSNYPLRRWP